VGPQHTWTAGRVVALVIGSLLLFLSAGCLIGGGTLLVADGTQRDDAGYLSTPAARVSTTGYAVTTSSFRLEGAGLDWAVDNLLGRARVEVSPAGGNGALFVGIARTDDAARYLDAVEHARLENLDLRWDGGRLDPSTTVEHHGGRPAVPPDQAGIWQESAGGPGTQALTWRPTAGDWTIVVMRADGGAGVTADVRAAATLPGLTWIAASILGTGVVLLVIGGLLVGLAVHSAATLPPVPVPAVPGPPAPRAPSADESERARTRT
jgi:hypothetical protein